MSASEVEDTSDAVERQSAKVAAAPRRVLAALAPVISDALPSGRRMRIG
jgi:hypothetical protein